LNKQSDYYYTYHSNHLQGISPYYASTPLKVILRDEYTLLIRLTNQYHTSAINLGIKGTIGYITEYNDTEKNIFNSSDIEAETVFNTVLSSNKGNNYTSVCHLWKPLNDNIRILCNLKDKDKLSSS
jgi:hypothetical protein